MSTRPVEIRLARSDVIFQQFLADVQRPLSAWGLGTIWTEEKLLPRLTAGAIPRSKFDGWRARMLNTARDGA